MSFAISLVPLFIFVLLESVLLKLATLLSRVRLFWNHCFRYGGLIALLSIGASSVIVASQHSPPLVHAMLIGAILHLALGTWYVATFGRNMDGERISVARAIVSMLIFLLLFSLIISGFMLLATILRSSTPY